MTGAGSMSRRPLGFYVFCVAGGVVGLRLLGMLFQSSSPAGAPAHDPPPVVAPLAADPLPAAAATPQPSGGPTCADLKPNLPRWAGLLPPGVPAEAAPLLAHRNRQAAPPAPIVTSAGLRFVTDTTDSVHLSRLEGGKLAEEAAVPMPKVGAKQIRAGDFAIASSRTVIAAVVQDYQDVFFFTVDGERWVASSAVKVPAAELKNMADARGFHLASGEEGWGLVMNFADGFQFASLDSRGAVIGKPATIKAHTWVVQPRLAWNGEGYGVLASRSDDGYGHSLGIWEFVEGKEPVYQPIVDAPRDAGVGTPVHYVGGWLLWEDGRYHFGVHIARGSDSKDALVHFKPGDAPRIEECKLSEP